MWIKAAINKGVFEREGVRDSLRCSSPIITASRTSRPKKKCTPAFNYRVRVVINVCCIIFDCTKVINLLIVTERDHGIKVSNDS